MQEMPGPVLYEKFFTFTPWGTCIKEVRDRVVEIAPQKGKVMDLMCGTGYLLRQISQKRRDLNCFGVDIDTRYVEYARRLTPRHNYEIGDARTYSTYGDFDVVLCTGGIHHVHDREQEKLIARMSKLVTKAGTVIIADPYVPAFSTKRKRMAAGATLGYHYILEVIKSGAPQEVIDAAIDILASDVRLTEWKTCVFSRHLMLQKHFKWVEMFQSWGPEKSWGDFWFVASN